MSQPAPSIDQLLDEAAHAFGQGRLDVAGECLQQVLDQDPSHFDALHISGVLEYQRGNHERAVTLIQRALEVHSGFAEAHYNLGKVLQASHRFPEAASAYHKAIELNPALDPAWFNLGLVQMELHRPQEALTAFRRAVEMEPGDPVYAFNLGTCLMDLKNWTAAGDAFERVVAAAPENFQAWNNLGIVLKEVGETGGSQEAYRRALAIEPRFADAHFNLGNLYEQEGELQSALGSYKQAIDLAPGFAKALNNRGNVHYLLKQYDEARQDYEQTLQLDPANESARHMLDALNGVTTATAPPDYVRRLFDKAAPEFESRLVDALGYRSPQELRALFDPLTPADLRLEKAVDLGCGTGLSGEVFRDRVRHLSGVDLSANMVALARQKHVYDALETGDLLGFLEQSAEHFDLFLATDVLVYLGDLRPLFDAVNRQAASAAWFLFSVERSGEADFCLRPTGRYGHSRDYLLALADEFGWEVAALEDTVIRTENDVPIPGYNVVLKKTGD